MLGYISVHCNYMASMFDYGDTFTELLGKFIADYNKQDFDHVGINYTVKAFIEAVS